MELDKELAAVEAQVQQLQQEYAMLQQAVQAKLQEVMELQGVHKWLTAKIKEVTKASQDEHQPEEAQ